MPTNHSEKLERMRQLRDAKVMSHLKQYAPVWLLDEVPNFRDDVLQFNVVFYHPLYGWVNRRYRFDAFNQVLYHQGQRVIPEEEAFSLEDKKPYIPAETINTVQSYGG